LRSVDDDMAQNATIFKVTLEIADIDRGYYHDHAPDDRAAPVGDR
jgi:hypothetical protein